MVQGMILSLNISTNILTSDPITGRQTCCLLPRIFLFIPIRDEVIGKRGFLPFYRVEVPRSSPLFFRGCFHLSMCYRFQIVKEKAMEQVQIAELPLTEQHLLKLDLLIVTLASGSCTEICPVVCGNRAFLLLGGAISEVQRRLKDPTLWRSRVYERA